jgi:methylmalonyl-CoA mutase N-terminal domain/subunit
VVAHILGGGLKFCRSLVGKCISGDDFGGRESIFWISHTNEFSGMAKRAAQPPHEGLHYEAMSEGL